MYLNTEQAARHLGLSPSFLKKARHYGTGPAFVRFGRAVRYCINDLNAYAAARAVSPKPCLEGGAP